MSTPTPDSRRADMDGMKGMIEAHRAVHRCTSFVAVGTDGTVICGDTTELDALRNPDGWYHADHMGTAWNQTPDTPRIPPKGSMARAEAELAVRVRQFKRVLQDEFDRAWPSPLRLAWFLSGFVMLAMLAVLLLVEGH